MTDDFNLDGPVYRSGALASAWCSHNNPIGACMQCNIDELESKAVV